MTPESSPGGVLWALALIPALGFPLAACGGRPFGAEPAAPPPTAGAAAPLSDDLDPPPPGIFHRVLPGQTLYTICRTYGVDLAEVAWANNLADPARIEVDRLLFIPRAEETLDVPITLPAVPAIPFLRPVDGPVTSSFGPRRGRMHYGLDLGAKRGAEVRASRGGRVLYAGSGTRGYGKLVILDHGDGSRTLYAHNHRILARTGARVRAGQVIARVGSSGNASGPHLHFEIRRENRPVDPRPFLRSGGTEQTGR